LAIVDDMQVHVVAENAVSVQISFFRGRLPGFNKRERWRAANEQRTVVRDAAAVESKTLSPAVGVTRHLPVVGRWPLQVAPRRRTLAVACCQLVPDRWLATVAHWSCVVDHRPWAADIRSATIGC
jgi:hypothetical protein